MNNRENDMKQNCYSLLAAAGLLAVPAAADVIEIDISPSGTSPGIELSPANEPHPVTSDGSGGEIFGGITFDTDTRVLEYALGYGSVAGFTNTTGPATAAHIHGPAPVGGTAPPIHDFVAAMDHLPAGDPADGGLIVGSVTLAAIVWAGGWRILAGAVTFGTLVAFIDYAGKFFRPLQELSQRYTTMQAAMASAERIFELLDTEVTIRAPLKVLCCCSGS